ncbi:MAG: PEP-CTERM sorting domain-containing protein [Betaproteobacteria bacterium]|nr:MAG: PEP-CTERM sorting domain-containing protein [Betaproteobacteria bacterium]
MVWHTAALLSFTAFLLAPLAQALPISVTSASGQRGDPVQLSLLDANTDDFVTATIEVSFDPVFLAFTAAHLGGLLDGKGVALKLNDRAQASGRLVISLAGITEIDQANGELLRVAFDIVGSAPLGDTEVSFQCQNPTVTDADSCALDYDIPRTIGSVSVLASSTAVPAPSSLMLLALGLVVISTVRRQVWSRTG